MPGFRHYMIVSIIALAVPCSVMAATRIIQILPERLKLSPANRREAVLADLNAILTGPAEPDTIATRPYLSDTGGLCRRDVIKLIYAPAGKRADWNGPLKPNGIRSIVPQYHFLGEEAKQSRESWEKACAQLSGDEVYWAFGDNDDSRAYDALGTLEIAVEAVKKGQEINIDCTDLDKPPKQPNCPSEFVAAAAIINGFSRCDDQPRDCYVFFRTGINSPSVRTGARTNARSPSS
ncbi:hypothetical protein NDN01_15405 [Sphingomonas sp. QA11]|uniref:hypothetical protein n=1 Tax=Sphingomonas sp. QA11 TaxID=2950605 RepID=UPI00234B45C1|nr:hypothetical protein [Sphingomonas sp. QA11]WCM25441.1 hypothetical protein NDN01_15405 [Sphingomonas sp. QA11]